MVKSVENYRFYNTASSSHIDNSSTDAYKTIVPQYYVSAANFEGRRDYDTYEGKTSHTARNIAIGSGVILAGLYTLAAFAGRGKGLTGKGAFKMNGDNMFVRSVNWCVENSYKSAKWLKEHTYDKIKKYFKKHE